MNKKKSLISIIIFLIAFVIGFNVYNGYYYIENIYKFNLGSVNKDHIEKVNKSGVWETIYNHYTDTLNMDIDTYEKIYNTHSACDYMDNILEPYYSQYGYDSVIASGLISKYKIANVYSYEKCCEIIGEKKINKDGLVRFLKKLSIDKKNYSDTENEKKYIEYAMSRLNLSISLLEGSTKSDMITKHLSSDTYCWISNGLRNRTHLKFRHKGDYITASNHYISPVSEVEFVSKNCIKVMSGEPYAVYIDEEIIMYNINYQLKKSLKDSLLSDMTTNDISFSNHTVSGNLYYFDQGMNLQSNTFTFDLKTGKADIK